MSHEGASETVETTSSIVADYLGREASEAAREIRRSGLRPVLERSFGWTPELCGQVVEQQPSAHQRVGADLTVRLGVAAPGAAPAQRTGVNASCDIAREGEGEISEQRLELLCGALFARARRPMTRDALARLAAYLPGSRTRQEVKAMRSTRHAMQDRREAGYHWRAVLLAALAGLLLGTMLVAVLPDGSSHALNAAGAFNGTPISGVQTFVDKLKGNLVWLGGTAMGLVIAVVGIMFMAGHSRAHDLAIRTIAGLAILASISGIVA
jgi:hypothetical protein